MVVLDRVAERLEARNAVAQVDALYEALLRQNVEDAVHAREADPLAARDQLAMDLLGAYATVLSVEKIDHARPRQPAPIPRTAKLGERLF